MSDNYRRKDRTEFESYGGVQTFIGITESHLAYKQVVSNGGSGGVDKMGTEDLLPYLKLHKDELDKLFV